MPTLTWLGQAGFLLEGRSWRCLFDPFLSDGPERLVPPVVRVADLPPVSAVFVSHEHGDHFDAGALGELLAVQPGARVVLPDGLDPGAGGLPARAIVRARPGDHLPLLDGTCHVVAALHGVEPSDAYRFGSFQGYVVEVDGVRVYHAGDTLTWDGLAGVLRDLRVDVALLPINGRDAEREAAGIVGNMDHREAVELAAEVGCRTLVPMHYGMFASNTVDPEIAVAYARSARPDLEVRLPLLGSAIAV